MKKATFRWLIIANAIIGLSAYAAAQDVDVGKAEYQSSCAPCHGIDAKGDGPVSKDLKTRPTDLTLLAKKNKGVFPVNSVYRTIDGRDQVTGHGTRDMPVWGYRFVPLKKHNLKFLDDYIYAPPGSPEPIVHARILAVIEYLNRIQEK
jgi:hypothetical protein